MMPSATVTVVPCLVLLASSSCGHLSILGRVAVTMPTWTHPQLPTTGALSLLRLAVMRWSWLSLAYGCLPMSALHVFREDRYVSHAAVRLAVQRGKSAIQAGCYAAAMCMALRNVRRRTLELASARRDKPRFGCELDLACGSISSWVNIPVGIVAGSASRGGVTHIGVTSGHVSPHLVASDGKQTRRRVIRVTGTPKGSIIPQLGGVVTQLSEHQHGFESHPRCHGC